MFRNTWKSRLRSSAGSTIYNEDDVQMEDDSEGAETIHILIESPEQSPKSEDSCTNDSDDCASPVPSNAEEKVPEIRRKVVTQSVYTQTESFSPDYFKQQSTVKRYLLVLEKNESNQIPEKHSDDVSRFNELCDLLLPEAIAKFAKKHAELHQLRRAKFKKEIP